MRKYFLTLLLGLSCGFCSAEELFETKYKEFDFSYFLEPQFKCHSTECEFFAASAYGTFGDNARFGQFARSWVEGKLRQYPNDSPEHGVYTELLKNFTAYTKYPSPNLISAKTKIVKKWIDVPGSTLPHIEMEIGGAETIALVDTGWGGTRIEKKYLPPQTREQLSFHIIDKQNFQQISVVDLIFMDDMKIGDANVGRTWVTSNDEESIIGFTILSRFQNIVFDRQNSLVTFNAEKYTYKKCADIFPVSMSVADSGPGHAYLATKVEVNGKQTNAFIDTGLELAPELSGLISDPTLADGLTLTETNFATVDANNVITRIQAVDSNVKLGDQVISGKFAVQPRYAGSPFAYAGIVLPASFFGKGNFAIDFRKQQICY